MGWLLRLMRRCRGGIRFCTVDLCAIGSVLALASAALGGLGERGGGCEPRYVADPLPSVLGVRVSQGCRQEGSDTPPKHSDTRLNTPFFSSLLNA